MGTDGETPAGATAANSTATDTEAPANGTSNEAIDIDAANDATVEGSGGNDDDDDWSIGEEVPALSNLDRIRGEMTLEGIERNARKNLPLRHARTKTNSSFSGFIITPVNLSMKDSSHA